MKIYRFDSKGEARFNMLDLCPHQLEIVLNALTGFRKEMDRRIGEDDETEIDLDRFLNKSYMSKNVRKCRLVIEEIEKMLTQARIIKDVPTTETEKM
jgi:hypothetical protein